MATHTTTRTTPILILDTRFHLLDVRVLQLPCHSCNVTPLQSAIRESMHSETDWQAELGGLIAFNIVLEDPKILPASPDLILVEISYWRVLDCPS